MKLDNDLITRFAKIVKIDNKSNDAATVRGVARTSEGKKYIQFDGADEGSMTPADTTVEVSDGDRVIATIKDHNAIITGNTSDPAVGVKTADGLRSSITQTAAEIRLEVKNEVSGLNSTISQTASEIRTEVSNVQSGLDSKITQTASEINTRIDNSNNQFTEFKQTVEGFYFTDDDGTVYIDGGSVYANNLVLTGSISWGDLASSTQTRITDAEDLATEAIDGADSAYTLAERAYNLAVDANNNIVTLPDYIKSTYIDETTIQSPTIIGGRFYAVGADPNYTNTFSVMDEDGFYIYHDSAIEDSDDDIDRLIPKMMLRTLRSGRDIRLVLGSGEDAENEWYNRFYISKTTSAVDIQYVTGYDGESVGFTMYAGSDEVIIHGTIGGTSGVFPVGYIYLAFTDDMSPAEMFGGDWNRMGDYMLYPTGDGSTMGLVGTVITEADSATDSIEYITIAAWCRIG